MRVVDFIIKFIDLSEKVESFEQSSRYRVISLSLSYYIVVRRLQLLESLIRISRCLLSNKIKIPRPLIKDENISL